MTDERRPVDPLYAELKTHPHTDATAFFLRVVAADESANMVDASRSLQQVVDVMGTTRPLPQWAILAEGLDRALGIVAATGRTRWVEWFGALAEQMGKQLREPLLGKPDMPDALQALIKGWAPFSGVAHYGGKSYEIFDASRPRSHDELEALLWGAETPEREDDRVLRMAQKLPNGHPVRMLLESTSAAPANDIWALPFLLERAGDKAGAAAATDRAIDAFHEDLQTAMFSFAQTEGEPPHLRLLIQLVSIEENATALYEASRHGSHSERAIAERHLAHIGALVSVMSSMSLPFFGESAESMWNDGRVAYKGDRARIPGAELTQADLREWITWFTKGELSDTRRPIFGPDPGIDGPGLV